MPALFEQEGRLSPNEHGLLVPSHQGSQNLRFIRCQAFKLPFEMQVLYLGGDLCRQGALSGAPKRGIIQEM